LTEGLNLVALRRTARAGLAVEAYRRKHGKLPERLEQLVPDFLPAAPTDLRDGQPLRMKRAGDEVVAYATQDATPIESRKLRHPAGRFPSPIFRVPARSGAGLPLTIFSAGSRRRMALSVSFSGGHDSTASVMFPSSGSRLSIRVLLHFSSISGMPLSGV